MLHRETALQSGADGSGSREQVREQIGSDNVDFAASWMQHGQPTYPLIGGVLYSNAPRVWVKQHKADIGKYDGLTIAERDRVKELARENRQLC